ncbi:MAG: YceI family protein [Chloroflexi bacterium]|nr:YceI family protein [Chloroflexota bacterium]
MKPFSIGARALLALLCLTLAGFGTAYAQSDDAAAPDAANPPPASAPPPGSVQLVVDPSNSQASYHAHEQLAGNDLPSDAVGTSHGVSGTIVLNPDGSVNSDQSQVTVDLTSLTSDEDQRDNFIKRNTLQVNQFPTATFVPTQVVGLDTPLPTSGQQTFQLMGNLTVHGVTQPVTWDVNAQFGDTSVSGDATTPVHITDFGMPIPSVAVVLSLNDALTLEMQFVANTQ